MFCWFFGVAYFVAISHKIFYCLCCAILLQSVSDENETRMCLFVWVWCACVGVVVHATRSSIVCLLCSIFHCHKSPFQTLTIMAKASAMSIADALEEKEFKEVIGVI